MNKEAEKIRQTLEYFVAQKFVNFEVGDNIILLLLPCRNKVHVPHFVDFKTFILQRKFVW
jgi:hypothetical protein